MVLSLVICLDIGLLEFNDISLFGGSSGEEGGIIYLAIYYSAFGFINNIS
jgi:hypothetical protein